MPTVGIDTSIVPLDANPDGTLRPPDSFQVAGWYRGGPAPGQSGTSIIAGHYDSKTGPGVFTELPKLKTGDQFQVLDDAGHSVAFRVDAIQQFAKNRFPDALVYATSRTPALRLITCGGSFDRRSGHYRDNIVVFASPAA